MSDGPHRSLPMSKAWKTLAERADNKAFDADDVAAALPAAMANDCRAVPSELILLLRDVFDPMRPVMFFDEAITRLGGLRSQCAGSPLAMKFVECGVAALSAGNLTAESLRSVLLQGFEANAQQRGRQIEEHYHRKCRDPQRAPAVRERLNEAAARANYVQLADSLLGNSRPGVNAPAKQTGLDDGVRIG